MLSNQIIHIESNHTHLLKARCKKTEQQAVLYTVSQIRWRSA